MKRLRNRDYIQRLRDMALPNSSAAEHFPCTIQETHWDSFSKNGLEVNRRKANKCMKIGFRLCVSNRRNETKVYWTREYTSFKKAWSSLRKSCITKAFKPSALGRDRGSFRRYTDNFKDEEI